MEVQVYFSNIGMNNFVEDLTIVRSHLEKIVKEDARGVDLRRITVKGDMLSKKILGYDVVDFAVKDQQPGKTYTQLKDFYVPMGRLM
ncbi:hypothetical protein HZA97_00985 [Candidatus Woesearchaeota archaeon]|nr:hypothetical protein [Candidatus Woesearchaeota archaeon]